MSGEMEVQRSLGRIEQGLKSLHEDIQEMKAENRIEIAKVTLVQTELIARMTINEARISKQETVFAKVLAIAGVVGAAGALFAEWLWKKVAS